MSVCVCVCVCVYLCCSLLVADKIRHSLLITHALLDDQAQPRGALRWSYTSTMGIHNAYTSCCNAGGAVCIRTKTLASGPCCYLLSMAIQPPEVLLPSLNSKLVCKLVTQHPLAGSGGNSMGG